MGMGNPQTTGMNGTVSRAGDGIAQARQSGLHIQIDDFGREPGPQVFRMADALPLGGGLLATKMGGGGTRIADTLDVIVKPEIAFGV
jgi:hypothetical protein